jgi:N-carbamoylputrescine amidase
MKVTVCELANEPDRFSDDWKKLAAHVQKEKSELVLLPEMVFYPWFVVTKPFQPKIWEAAVAAHEEWLNRLEDLSPAVVLGSRPIQREEARLNQGFTWTGEGLREAHLKYYLPDEEGFWEASWYQPGSGEFQSISSEGLKIGFAICTDLWFFQHARAYGKQGIHILAVPRATPGGSLETWLTGGRAASVVSGAYCLSSNRVVEGEGNGLLGGMGWITGPDGEVLGLTSRTAPFLTLDIDLEDADRAKKTYPRYVRE